MHHVLLDFPFPCAGREPEQYTRIYIIYQKLGSWSRYAYQLSIINCKWVGKNHD